jgi:hypothetical protein
MRSGYFRGALGAWLLVSCGAAQAREAEKSVMLPDRLLECSVGHVINFDPSHDQTAAELRYDGFHRLVIFLARNRKQVGRPPDATEDAPKVDPRTRLVADPDAISGQPGMAIGRLIDLWPERVELSTPIGGEMLNAIVLHPIDEAAGTLNLFMLRASELTHFDPAHIYQGTCHIKTGAAANLPNAVTKAK